MASGAAAPRAAAGVHAAVLSRAVRVRLDDGPLPPDMTSVTYRLPADGASAAPSRGDSAAGRGGWRDGPRVAGARCRPSSRVRGRPALAAHGEGHVDHVGGDDGQISRWGTRTRPRHTGEQRQQRGHHVLRNLEGVDLSHRNAADHQQRDAHHPEDDDGPAARCSTTARATASWRQVGRSRRWPAGAGRTRRSSPWRSRHVGAQHRVDRASAFDADRGRAGTTIQPTRLLCSRSPTMMNAGATPKLTASASEVDLLAHPGGRVEHPATAVEGVRRSATPAVPSPRWDRWPSRANHRRHAQADGQHRHGARQHPTVGFQPGLDHGNRARTVLPAGAGRSRSMSSEPAGG